MKEQNARLLNAMTASDDGLLMASLAMMDICGNGMLSLLDFLFTSHDVK